MSSTFQKFTSSHFIFMKDLYLYLFWLNEGNPKGFSLLQKRWDVKTAFCVCFRVSCNRGSAQPQQRVGPPGSFPRPASISASGHHTLTCVSGHLCFISFILCIYRGKMCPECNCFFLLYAIWTCISFHRNTLLSDSMGNLYCIKITTPKMISHTTHVTSKYTENN